jgi:hypothetical protein
MNPESNHRRNALLVAALVMNACSSAEEVGDIVAPTITPGIAYSASATETRFDAGNNLLVTLSIENTSIVPVTLTYPASCPLRIRLYQPADNALVYDETRLACSTTEPATLTISPGTIRTIGSGFRGMVWIVGDSLRFATYRVVAVPQMEGAHVFEIAAGNITLRQ